MNELCYYIQQGPILSYESITFQSKPRVMNNVTKHASLQCYLYGGSHKQYECPYKAKQTLFDATISKESIGWIVPTSIFPQAHH